MIDIKKLIKSKEEYTKSFRNKGYLLDAEINDVINLYQDYLKHLNIEQTFRENLNEISFKIKNDPSLKEEAQKISLKAKKETQLVNEFKKKYKEKASYFPNISLKSVPIGKNENDNVVISEHLNQFKDKPFAKPHWEIIEKRKIILTEEAANISGARQVIYNGKSALFIKALEMFMLENSKESGYQTIEVPVLVNKESMFNTGQLPKFGEDAYKVGDQYLIPTSEVPLTNLVANKILKEEDLPLKFTAASNCFRKEAGSAGKDTRGIIRLHQFRKVELVKIGTQNNLDFDFNEILSTATRVLEKLEIPYRLVQLCTGDSSFTSAKTIDIEVWMPGVKAYREISSVSACTDFQSRRMKSRYITKEGKKELTYTYNGSSLAIERTFAAIVENYVNAQGKITVPKVLKKYLDFEEI